jgi:hypothetical protein
MVNREMAACLPDRSHPALAVRRKYRAKSLKQTP